MKKKIHDDMSKKNTEIPVVKVYTYQAEFIQAYDGDTITVRLDLGLEVQSIQRLRLARINAWEVRGKEKDKGIIARDAIRGLLRSEKALTIQTIRDKKGKYGRYLAEVWIENPVFDDIVFINVNDWMVGNGFAKYQEY